MAWVLLINRLSKEREMGDNEFKQEFPNDCIQNHQVHTALTKCLMSMRGLIMWKRRRIQTIIGPGTRFEGEIQSKGTLRIDGILDGQVTDAEEVIVGESGMVKGDVNAKSVIVAGNITGDINASDSIEMLPECRVSGDIRTAHLSVVEGVIFEGRCIMTKGKNGVIKIDKVRDEQPPKTPSPSTN